jgi:hypothetical protein
VAVYRHAHPRLPQLHASGTTYYHTPATLRSRDALTNKMEMLDRVGRATLPDPRALKVHTPPIIPLRRERDEHV